MPRRGMKNYREGGKTTAEMMREARAEKCKFSPAETIGLATYEKNAFTRDNLLALDMPSSIIGGTERKIVLYRFTDAEVKTLGKKAFQMQPDNYGKLVYRWNCTNYEKSTVYNTKKADVVHVWNTAEFEKAYDKWALKMLEILWKEGSKRTKAPNHGEFLEAILFYENPLDWRQNSEAFNKAPDGYFEGKPVQVGYEGKTWASVAYLEILARNNK